MSHERCSSTPDDDWFLGWGSGVTQVDDPIVDHAYLADRDARHMEREDLIAGDALRAWVASRPTARCVRLYVMPTGEWCADAMHLGESRARGYGRCVDSAVIDVVRDLRRRVEI